MRAITRSNQVAGGAHGTPPPRDHLIIGCAGAEQVPGPTVRYAVITPEGLLMVREAVGDTGPDEWGEPYQHELWTAVRDQVDPDGGAVNGVPLAGGMRAKVADAADHLPRVHPPNPVGSAVLISLSCAPRVWRGSIAIMGEETDEGITTSLTADQLDTLAGAHRRALSFYARCR